MFMHIYAATGQGGNKIIVTGYERHSQSVSAAKLQPWFAVENVVWYFVLIAHAWLALVRPAHTFLLYFSQLKPILILSRTLHALLCHVIGFLLL